MESMLMENKQQRLYSLDFLKFLAAVMITNSHFQIVYENVNRSLATFGVQGNALFFFVSGYLLMMGLTKRKLSFQSWYGCRVRRLWPSVFIWVIVTAAIWGKPITIGRLVFMDDYWFLQAIALSYIVFYFVAKYAMAILGGAN